MPLNGSTSGPEGDELSRLRRRITELVARNAVGMVQSAIDAVNEDGAYQAIKYLFEMVGLYPAPPSEEAALDDSLAATLLKRLGAPETAEDASTNSHI